jgi:pseudolysin/vibriolysin
MSQGDEKVFTFYVPRNTQNLLVSTSASGPIDVDLFVRRSSAPTLIQNDGFSAGNTSNENVFINAPVEGLYYIRVSGTTSCNGLAPNSQQSPCLPANSNGNINLNIDFNVH